MGSDLHTRFGFQGIVFMQYQGYRLIPTNSLKLQTSFQYLQQFCSATLGSPLRIPSSHETFSKCLTHAPSGMQRLDLEDPEGQGRTVFSRVNSYDLAPSTDIRVGTPGFLMSQSINLALGIGNIIMLHGAGRVIGLQLRRLSKPVASCLF